MDLPAQCFRGRQSGSRIIHAGDGYYYLAREIRGSRVRLYCRYYYRSALKCGGTAALDIDTLTLRHNAQHVHPPDPFLEEEMTLRQDMVEAARSNIYGDNVRTIIRNHKIRCGRTEVASRFSSARMLSSLYRARADNYPNIPNSLIHLGVLLGLPNARRLCRTVDGQDFIYQGVVGCIQQRTAALIFVSGRMCHFLNSVENLHGDGTFRKRSRKPKMAQIFNITVQFGRNVIGVVRVLMMSRTEGAYTAVIRYIVNNLAPNVNPARVHCDFEKAQMNGFHSGLPRARIVGCLWHYGVAFSSQARVLGLAALANQNEIVHGFIRCLAGAPLLPEHLIWQGVCDIWEEIVAHNLGDTFLPLLQYFERVWKPRLAELSVFGVPERTNNCAESDNRSLANVIPQNHPNIWHLIGAFVKLEFLAHCDVLAIQRGCTITNNRRYTTVANNRRVQSLSTLLVARHITPSEFLHAASYAILGAVNHGLRIVPGEEAYDSAEEDDPGEENDSAEDDSD